MPNWCYTNITIEHNNQKELEKFEKLLNEWTSHNYIENGFGNDWLGNVVGNSGIGTIDIGTIDTNKDTDLNCRGSLVECDLDDRYLTITTETAWVPMLKMWSKLIDKYLPGAELTYEAEESGVGLYCTNNQETAKQYIIDSWDMPDIESDWEASEEYIVKILQKLLDEKESDIDKLIDIFEDSDYSDYMSIHKWEYAEISEFD